MHARTWPAIALAFVATLAVASRPSSAQQGDGVRAVDGEWIYVEDRTPGRSPEQQGPPMNPKFVLRVEGGAVIMLRRDGPVRIALDGSATEVDGGSSVSRYRGAWKDGAFGYDTEIVRKSDQMRVSLIRREFRPTTEGLLVRVAVDPPAGFVAVALYRHPTDIPLPVPAKAAMTDIAWLAGAWVGTRGTGGSTSIEERWSPALGGAMLAVSRTVSRGKMVAFEFLRIVERDGGLVYIAQPNGAPPTEFVLTEAGKSRAVFENPRHDSPQRIVYELTTEGGLTAAIGYAKGGRPQRFEFKREAG